MVSDHLQFLIDKSVIPVRNQTGRVIVFIDESGLSERPTRVRSWAPRGQTPVIQFHFNWKPLLIIWDGMKAHRSRLVKSYLGSLDGEMALAFLPPYAPDLNPVEYLWAWLKRHAMANYCLESIDELSVTARSKLRGAQKRGSLIVAFCKQAELFCCHVGT